MGSGVDLNRRSKEGEISNLHLTYIQHQAVEVEKNPFAEQDVGPLVAIKWRLHPNRIASLAEEFLQYASASILVPFTCSIEVLA